MSSQAEYALPQFLAFNKLMAECDIGPHHDMADLWHDVNTKLKDPSVTSNFTAAFVRRCPCHTAVSEEDSLKTKWYDCDNAAIIRFWPSCAYAPCGSGPFINTEIHMTVQMNGFICLFHRKAFQIYVMLLLSDVCAFNNICLGFGDFRLKANGEIARLFPKRLICKHGPCNISTSAQTATLICNKLTPNQRLRKWKRHRILIDEPFELFPTSILPQSQSFNKDDNSTTLRFVQFGTVTWPALMESILTQYSKSSKCIQAIHMHYLTGVMDVFPLQNKLALLRCSVHEQASLDALQKVVEQSPVLHTLFIDFSSIVKMSLLMELNFNDWPLLPQVHRLFIRLHSSFDISEWNAYQMKHPHTSPPFCELLELLPNIHFFDISLCNPLLLLSSTTTTSNQPKIQACLVKKGIHSPNLKCTFNTWRDRQDISINGQDTCFWVEEELNAFECVCDHRRLDTCKLELQKPQLYETTLVLRTATRIPWAHQFKCLHLASRSGIDVSNGDYNLSDANKHTTEDDFNIDACSILPIFTLYLPETRELSLMEGSWTAQASRINIQAPNMHTFKFSAFDVHAGIDALLSLRSSLHTLCITYYHAMNTRSYGCWHDVFRALFVQLPSNTLPFSNVQTLHLHFVHSSSAICECDHQLQTAYVKRLFPHLRFYLVHAENENNVITLGSLVSTTFFNADNCMIFSSPLEDICCGSKSVDT